MIHTWSFSKSGDIDATVTEIKVTHAEPQHRGLVLHFHRSLYLTYRRQLLAEREQADEIWALSAYRDFEAVLEEDVDSLLARPGTQVLLAWKGEEPCGYITGRVEIDRRRALSRRGVLEDWFVEEQFRGIGAGQALFKTLTASFQDAGCEVIEATTWPDNQETRALYDTLGFSEVEVRYRLRL